MAKILAVSGSPIKDGNIESAMKYLLEASGKEWEMIRLSSMNIKPCIACLKCAHKNRCVQKDDMNDVLEKIIRAEALVVSGFPTFFSVNALTKTFIERMYPLKHNKMLTRGKLGIVVAGGFREPDVVADYLSFFFSWFKMELLGTLKIGGNAPCLSCGYGETCDYSNVTIMHGEGAQIKSEMFYSFENDEDSKQEALLLGQRLGAAL